MQKGLLCKSNIFKITEILRVLSLVKNLLLIVFVSVAIYLLKSIFGAFSFCLSVL